MQHMNVMLDMNSFLNTYPQEMLQDEFDAYKCYDC